MRFALCQLETIWENKNANYEKAERFIDAAAEQGCDIIFFPEMSFTGFSMHIEKTQETHFETCDRMKEFSALYNLAIGFGWVKASETPHNHKAENHYTIVNQKGVILLDYTKIHPFSYANEDQYFSSGNEIVSCDFQHIKLSTFICYDLRFPEIFQAISNQITHIFVPANWPGARNRHWETLLSARAIENQVTICGINCVGDINGIHYLGNSLIVNPNGEIKCQLLEKEGLIIRDTDHAAEEMRASFPMKRDRREKLYSKYYDL